MTIFDASMLYNKVSTYDMRYIIDVEYDYYTDCYSNGCSEEGICRCGRMDDVRIKSDFTVLGAFDAFMRSISSLIMESYQSTRKTNNKNKKPTLRHGIIIDPFLDYCVDRLIRVHQLYDQTKYQAVVAGGYYGDEIDGVYFDYDGLMSLCEEVTKLFYMKNSDRIRFVLAAEYDFLIDRVKDATFTIKKVDIEKLKPAMYEHIKKIQKNIYTTEMNYLNNRMSDSMLLDVAVGIYRQVGDSYLVIDGYHRFDNVRKGKKKKVNIIVCDGMKD